MSTEIRNCQGFTGGNLKKFKQVSNSKQNFLMFVCFLPHFSLRFILYYKKTFLSFKTRGSKLRTVSNQEQVIMAREGSWQFTTTLRVDNVEKKCQADK